MELENLFGSRSRLYRDGAHPGALWVKHSRSRGIVGKVVLVLQLCLIFFLTAGEAVSNWIPSTTLRVFPSILMDTCKMVRKEKHHVPRQLTSNFWYPGRRVMGFKQQLWCFYLNNPAVY